MWGGSSAVIGGVIAEIGDQASGFGTI
jgi:hypothetical protein